MKTLQEFCDSKDLFDFIELSDLDRKLLGSSSLFNNSKISKLIKNQNQFYDFNPYPDFQFQNIKNIGNTCYIDTVLSSLLHVLSPAKLKSDNNPNEHIQNIIKELLDLIYKFHSINHQVPINMSNLKKLFPKVNSLKKYSKCNMMFAGDFLEDFMENVFPESSFLIENIKIYKNSKSGKTKLSINQITQKNNIHDITLNQFENIKNTQDMIKLQYNTAKLSEDNLFSDGNEVFDEIYESSNIKNLNSDILFLQLHRYSENETKFDSRSIFPCTAIELDSGEKLSLTSIICYKRKHYTSYNFNSEIQYLDDLNSNVVVLDNLNIYDIQKYHDFKHHIENNDNFFNPFTHSAIYVYSKKFYDRYSIPLSIQNIQKTNFISSGSFNNVYKVCAKVDNKIQFFALRKSKQIVQSEEEIENFKNSIKIYNNLISLDIPVAKLYDHNEPKIRKRTFQLLELAENNLYEFITDTRITKTHKVNCIEQIINIINKLYNNKIWCIDIKPANIIVKKINNSYKVLLIDIDDCILNDNHKYSKEITVFQLLVILNAMFNQQNEKDNFYLICKIISESKLCKDFKLTKILKREKQEDYYYFIHYLASIKNYETTTLQNSKNLFNQFLQNYDDFLSIDCKKCNLK